MHAMMLANCKGNRPCQILKLPIGLYKTIQCKKSAHPTEYVFLTKNGGGLKSFLVFCLLLTNSRTRCRKLAGSTGKMQQKVPKTSFQKSFTVVKTIKQILYFQFNIVWFFTSRQFLSPLDPDPHLDSGPYRGDADPGSGSRSAIQTMRIHNTAQVITCM